NRLRLGFKRGFGGRSQLFLNALQSIGFMMNPCREPTPDKASARNRRQIMESIEQIMSRKALNYSEREGGASYPSARETERGMPFLINAFYDRREMFGIIPLRVLIETFGKRVVQAFILFGQHLTQRNGIVRHT